MIQFDKVYLTDIEIDTELERINENYFNEIDLSEILKKQNLLSDDEKEGFIWVLNTSIFLIVDYNFNLLWRE